MSLDTIAEIPTAWLDNLTDYPLLAELHEKTNRWSRNSEFTSIPGDSSDALLEEVIKIGEANSDKSIPRSVRAVLSARGGDEVKIPKFVSSPEIMKAFLRKDFIDGWLYRKVEGSNGEAWYVPALVTNVSIETERSGDKQFLVINMLSVGVETGRESSGMGTKAGPQSSSVHFDPTDLTNKTAAQALASRNLFHENQELREAYNDYADEFRNIVRNGFAKQFTAAALEFRDDRTYTRTTEQNVRVVMDTELTTAVDLDNTMDFFLGGGYRRSSDNEGKETSVPLSLRVSVFDLRHHDFHTVYTMALTPYEYRTDLRDKLILPDSHRDLLDVLTTDTEVFSSDMIEGKSAGNVILARGVPGVGKTLTAEVYSEIVKRPLYAVHSGELGTNPDHIRTNLERIFKRAARWDAVLLLDEADVFVRERGDSIQHNAIVAEFLRTLEYFDGLLFMTTNRDDTIDEAIVSRCAAIISYEIPEPKDAEAIWVVLADTLGVKFNKALAKTLVGHLPAASPRDIKMLLRLAARLAMFHKEDLAEDHFRQASMFRGVKWEN